MKCQYYSNSIEKEKEWVYSCGGLNSLILKKNYRLSEEEIAKFKKDKKNLTNKK
jgi:hypothetical protein